MNDLPKQPKLRIKHRGGAPKGNCNALKTGRHGAEVRALRALARCISRQAREAIALGGIVSRQI